MPATDLAFIPSPSRSVWELGPIPIRAYALCIILGIVAAIWIAERRWVARGGRRGTVSDIAVWAVVFGLVGGRLYHVITDNELYFRAGRDPWRALYVWEGGLGVWGAIALGGVGAWIGCRRRGIKLPPYADAAAPGIAVAQAIGRWGNWFNQELFGRPTDLPWAVKIDPGKPNTVPGATTYHPTFLYESLWDLALAGALVWVDRRFKLGRGRVFALYVMGYTAGRVWIELLRIDTANRIFGVRLNVWTSIVVFAGGLIYFLLHPGPRETVVEPRTPPPGSTGEPREDATAAETPAATADNADGTGSAGAAAADADDATAADDEPEPAGTPSPPAGADATTADDEPEPAGTPSPPAGADATTADDEPEPAGTAVPADSPAGGPVAAGTSSGRNRPQPGSTRSTSAGAQAADADQGTAAEAPTSPERTRPLSGSTDADGKPAGPAADGVGASSGVDRSEPRAPVSGATVEAEAPEPAAPRARAAGADDGTTAAAGTPAEDAAADEQSGSTARRRSRLAWRR